MKLDRYSSLGILSLVALWLSPPPPGGGGSARPGETAQGSGYNVSVTATFTPSGSKVDGSFEVTLPSGNKMTVEKDPTPATGTQDCCICVEFRSGEVVMHAEICASIKPPAPGQPPNKSWKEAVGDKPKGDILVSVKQPAPGKCPN